MNRINVNGQSFEPYIGASSMQKRWRSLAVELNALQDEHNFLWLSILNGAFMFTADMIRLIQASVELEFVKYQSYQGMQAQDHHKSLIGISKNQIVDRHILIVEDIVDTGNTIHYLSQILNEYGASSVSCMTAFYKPNAYKYPVKPKLIGFEIENDFVIGYGMDYEQRGRQLQSLYRLSK